MAILLILIAALATGFNNFSMRRSIDAGGTSRAFLVIQLAASLVACLILDPLRTEALTIDPQTIFLGVLGGVILAAMMWGMGRAFESGPAGLTIAGMNSATVMPGIMMALFFGASWGHPYTSLHAMGSFLVVIGLFWAGWETETRVQKKIWIKAMVVAFVCHILLLCFLQWRVLLLRGPWGVSPLVPFRLDPSSVPWILPIMYLVASSLQLIGFVRAEHRLPKKAETIYGLLGGFANGGAVFLLTAAPEYATPLENAMIYPIFAIAVMGLCNLWGQLLYKERVNWLANGLCMMGLLVGSL